MSVQSQTFGATPGGVRTVRVTSPVSPRICHTGGTAAQVSTDFTNATPVITEQYLCEVYIPAPMVLSGISIFNGSDVTGNLTAALYDVNGNLLGKTASTAGSGTDAYQNIPFATTYQNNNGTTITATSGQLRVEAGTYYVSTQYSSATARYNTHTIGAFGAGKITGQVYGTIPATVAVPVTFTTALGNVASLY